MAPRGAILSLVAALTVFDAYNGLIPPSWAHGGRSTQKPWNDNASNDYHGVAFGADSQFSVEFGAEEAEKHSAIVALDNT